LSNNESKARWMPKLWTKVVLSVAIVQIPLFTVVTILYIQEVRNDYLETVQWHSLTISQQLQKRAADLSGYTPEMQRTLGLTIDSQSLLNDNKTDGVIHIGVIGSDGKTIASTDSWRLNKVEFEGLVKEVYEDPAPLTFIASNSYETLIPVYTAGSATPVSVIYIGFSREVVSSKIINTIKYAAVLYFIFLLLSSILISVLIRRFVTQPIAELSKAATNLADDNLSTRIPEARSHEVGLLADSFVNMSQSITDKLASVKESEDRFRTVSKLSNDILWEWHIEEGVVNWFGNIGQQLGYEESEIPRTLDGWKKIIHPEDLEHVEESLTKSLEERVPWYEEYRAITKDGEIQYWVDRGEIRTEIDGRPLIMSGAITDITEQKQANVALKKSEERFSLAMQGANDGLWDWDLKTDEVYYSPRWKSMLGYAEDEVEPNLSEWKRLVHKDDMDRTLFEVEACKKGNKDKFEVEFRMQHKDGQYIDILSRAFVVKDEKGVTNRLVGTHVDITLRKQADEKISYQASHDALTGLVNRREFEHRAEQLLSTIRQDNDEHALCFMDLDQFKVVNDTGGHVAGDEMLRQLGAVLQKTVRHHDTLARLGGDEFGVLIEHCSLEDAHHVAKSLQTAIQDYQFSWGDRSFKVGVSMGLVPISEVTTNITELLRDADAACYMAKDKGRNRIHIYHAEDSDIAQRHGEMQWVTRIQHALEEDKFCLYAQSIVPLDNNVDKHYELLVRMTDDKGEIVPPGAFLPAAERYDLMIQVDRWVIGKAFCLLAENPAFQSEINFISINLSGPSLAEQNVLDLIIKQLDKTGIDGEKVCFEITETAAISNLGKAINFISTLKALGCRFALDDFGSGLSSFGYLKNLPVDYLKIDGMFVKDIVDDPIDHAMVKSINEIGHVMGMKTIAEFVENDEIKGMLREIGVNYAQGYGIDKPMPLDDLLDDKYNDKETL
jgi:diguanylate cyclase (GGDEF)-like protein/PAS domain S-box-containing protein